MIDQSLITAAQKAQIKYGVPASVSLAQYGLESAWGTHMSGKNNPFGIKAKTGTSLKTQEQNSAGVAHTETATFADYVSVDEAFDAHGKLLATHPAYAAARAVRSNPDAYANALTGHYATDVRYGAKLIAIMKARNLYQYDVSPASAVTETKVTPKPTQPVIPVTTTVAAGAGGAVVVAAGAAVAVAPHSIALVVVLGVLVVGIIAAAIYFHRKDK